MRVVPTVCWTLLAGAVGGCSVTEAPEDLAELSRFLYQVWDAPADGARADALHNLEIQLQGVPDLATAKTNDRSWSILPLREEDVATITRPDRDLNATVNVALAFESVWPIEDHARLQIELDQTPPEPTAPFYDREITNLSDAACFVDASCEVMETFNVFRRENLLLSADMELLKTFRWVAFEDDDGNERRGFYSRSWFEKSWPGDRGNVWLYQSYSIDAWIERADGTVWRYQTLWSETDLGLAVADDTVAFTVKDGTDKAMEAGDQAIADLYHGGELPPRPEASSGRGR